MNPSNQQTPNNTTNTNKSKPTTAIIVGILVLFFICVGAYALVSRKQTTQTPNTNSNSSPDMNNSQASGKTAQMTTEPATSVTKIGEITTFSIWVDSGSQQISTVEAYLTYPTDKFEFVNIDGNGSAFGVQAEQSEKDGKISITRAQVGGVSGKQLLAKVNLKAKIENGEGTLAFTDESKIFTLATEPQNILGNTSGTTLTIGE